MKVTLEDLLDILAQSNKRSSWTHLLRSSKRLYLYHDYFWVESKLLNDLCWGLQLNCQTRCQMIGLLLMDCQLDSYHFFMIFNNYNARCAVSNLLEQKGTHLSIRNWRFFNSWSLKLMVKSLTNSVVGSWMPRMSLVLALRHNCHVAKFKSQYCSVSPRHVYGIDNNALQWWLISLSGHDRRKTCKLIGRTLPERLQIHVGVKSSSRVEEGLHPLR